MKRLVNASFTGATLKIDGYLELVIPPGCEIVIDGDRIVIQNQSYTFARPGGCKPLAEFSE